MARPDTPRFHGFLPVDKPAGLTSHDVVSRIRRLTGQRTVGHTGTLDPATTGVLPIALGVATRTLPFAADSTKTYRAQVTFGVATDTLDADGMLIGTAALIPRLPDIETALANWIGTREQVAPRHAAIQVEGRRLYDLARAGIAFDPPVRTIDIFELTVLDYTPPVLTICVDCGAGTYVRSLARDLGHALGTVAHLSDLVRIRSGSFTLNDCWTLAQIAEMPLAEAWPSIAYHPDVVLTHLPAIILDEQNAQRWAMGQRVESATAIVPGHVRVYDIDGAWLGIGEVSQEFPAAIQPRRVIAEHISTQQPGPAER